MPTRDSASNAQVTFMALITSGVQLIPATMIGVLAAAGSVAPTAIIAPSLIATGIGTAAAVVDGEAAAACVAAECRHAAGDRLR